MYPVVDQAKKGEQLTVMARNGDSSWYKVEMNSPQAWVAATLVQLSGDSSDVPVADFIPPAPTPVAGIGVSRAEIQESFERAGFEFGAVKQTGGQPLVTGALGSYEVELRGPANNLTSARIRIYTLGNSDVGGLLAALFLANVAPADIGAIGTWMSENSRTAATTGIQKKWGQTWITVSMDGLWMVIEAKASP